MADTSVIDLDTGAVVEKRGRGLIVRVNHPIGNPKRKV
jgi:hypothetical protein